MAGQVARRHSGEARRLALHRGDLDGLLDDGSRLGPGGAAGEEQG